MVKREKWTEADIDALPGGEHDYFDRKSGLLCGDTDKLLGVLAKAVSAFANSGGGHLILGVDDNGVPDGVPTHQGKTTVRDWLEQKIPNLVSYPLSDFRVHIVEASEPSRIPKGRDVIVIDIGDSALAPHQCAYGGGDARKYAYYYRQAGRSEPAPHFYLELLRQRLVNPVLEAKLERMTPIEAKRFEEGIRLETELRFRIENVGRVAAYKWQHSIVEITGVPEGRAANLPKEVNVVSHGIRVDDTILPGCSLAEDRKFTGTLNPLSKKLEGVRSELHYFLSNLKLGCRIATETSPGEVQHLELKAVLDLDKLSEFVVKGIGT